MRPFCTESPSSGCTASNGPARSRMLGSMPCDPSPKCTATNTAAGKSAGKPLTSLLSASKPPAEAPIATMSCPIKG